MTTGFASPRPHVAAEAHLNRNLTPGNWELLSCLAFWRVTGRRTAGARLAREPEKEFAIGVSYDLDTGPSKRYQWSYHAN